MGDRGLRRLANERLCKNSQLIDCQCLELDEFVFVWNRVDNSYSLLKNRNDSLACLGFGRGFLWITIAWRSRIGL